MGFGLILVLICWGFGLELDSESIGAKIQELTILGGEEERRGFEKFEKMPLILSLANLSF